MGEFSKKSPETSFKELPLSKRTNQLISIINKSWTKIKQIDAIFLHDKNLWYVWTSNSENEYEHNNLRKQ